MPEPLDRLVELGRALRREGIAVGPGSVLDLCRAAALLPPRDVYWAGRLTLVSRHEQIPVYDQVFRSVFGDAPQPLPQPPRPRLRLAVGAAEEPAEAGQAGALEAPALGRASRVELLRHKHFDRCTPEELAEIAQLAAAVARSLPRRRSRRRRSARDGSLDLQRTLRRALRTGGEPFERRFRERRPTPRRIVLLLDVSGSMADHSRALLQIAHALHGIHPQSQVFCFGTRLTSASRALAVRDADEALRRIAVEVADWEGGTRIGDALKEFLDGSGHRSAARGAIVVICSDGLEIGEPELLRAQMERLARLAHRVVWLNPLKRDVRYEPLARGMQAALPYVDVFAAGDTLAGLEAVARQVERPWCRPSR